MDQVTNNGTRAKIVTNTHQVKDWKYKEGKKSQLWVNKTIKGPTLSSNSEPCLKYNVRGTCVDYCANEAFHKKLEGEDLKQTDSFIKQV